MGRRRQNWNEGRALSTHASKDFWLTSLRADAADFRKVAIESDPAAGVPSCPGWSVLDLIHHLGATFEWFRSNAGRHDTSPPDMSLHPRQRDTSGFPPAPEVVAWWDAELAA